MDGSTVSNTKCTFTLWTYFTADLLGDPFGSVWCSSHDANLNASPSTTSTSTTTPTASTTSIHLAHNDASSASTHSQYPPVSDSIHNSPSRLPSAINSPPTRSEFLSWTSPTLIVAPSTFWPPHPQQVVQQAAPIDPSQHISTPATAPTSIPTSTSPTTIPPPDTTATTVPPQALEV